MSIPGLKLSETDDEFFGKLDSRSNLANLFGVNQQPDDINQSLKYKPQKPTQLPTDSGDSKTSTVAWNIQVAKVVTAFKLVNQENVSQGRVGLALLKNAQNGLKFIVYRSKSNVLATKTLQSDAKLILKSSYLQFHDDTQQFWSIFLEPSDENEFVDHIPSDFLAVVQEEINEEPDTPEEPKAGPPASDTDITSKAKLLSRMAKMGQPLPKLSTPITTTDMSDSSDTEVIKIPPKPNIAPRKVSKQLVSVSNAIPTTSLMAYAPQIQESQYMNMVLTENRTQNTEVRINLSKLETKIERVLDKIDSISLREPVQGNGKDKDDEILALEEKILELRKENRQLRQSAREMEAKMSVPVRKEPKLKMDMFSAFDDVLDKMGVHLEDCADAEDVTMELLEKSRSRLNQLEEERRNIDKQLESSKAEVQSMKTISVDLQKASKALMDAQNELENLSKENQDLKTQLDSVKNSCNDKLPAAIKEIMNNLYGSLASSLETSSEPLTKEVVLRICGIGIRTATINAIQGNTD